MVKLEKPETWYKVIGMEDPIAFQVEGYDVVRGEAYLAGRPEDFIRLEGCCKTLEDAWRRVLRNITERIKSSENDLREVLRVAVNLPGRMAAYHLREQGGVVAGASGPEIVTPIKKLSDPMLRLFGESILDSLREKSMFLPKRETVVYVGRFMYSLNGSQRDVFLTWNAGYGWGLARKKEMLVGLIPIASERGIPPMRIDRIVIDGIVVYGTRADVGDVVEIPRRVSPEIPKDLQELLDYVEGFRYSKGMA